MVSFISLFSFVMVCISSVSVLKRFVDPGLIFAVLGFGYGRILGVCLLFLCVLRL